MTRSHSVVRGAGTYSGYFHWPCILLKIRAPIFLPFPPFFPYLCSDGNWTQGLPHSQPFKLFLFLKQPLGPVEADFQYREVPCFLGDLIQLFQLLPLCVVPFVWQDIHECHLSPKPHPAQACRHGRSRWVLAASGSCCARVWWVGHRHMNLLFEPPRDSIWSPVQFCLCRGQEEPDT